MIETRRWACHEAVLDVVTGEGALVLPRREDDVSGLARPWGTAHSLHAADWDAAMADLLRWGWVPSEDEDGMLVTEGRTPDGREVVGLYGSQRLIENPSIAECAESWRMIHELTGLRKAC